MYFSVSMNLKHIVSCKLVFSPQRQRPCDQSHLQHDHLLEVMIKKKKDEDNDFENGSWLGRLFGHTPFSWRTELAVGMALSWKGFVRISNQVSREVWHLSSHLCVLYPHSFSLAHSQTEFKISSSPQLLHHPDLEQVLACILKKQKHAGQPVPQRVAGSIPLRAHAQVVDSTPQEQACRSQLIDVSLTPSPPQPLKVDKNKNKIKKKNKQRNFLFYSLNVSIGDYFASCWSLYFWKSYHFACLPSG